jgi:hypothetical protein
MYAVKLTDKTGTHIETVNVVVTDSYGGIDQAINEAEDHMLPIKTWAFEVTRLGVTP